VKAGKRCGSVVTSAPAQIAALCQSEVELFRKVAKSTGIKLDPDSNGNILTGESIWATRSTNKWQYWLRR